MATPQEVVEIIVNPMITLYNAPDGNMDAERLRAIRDAYIDALTPFSARALKLAWSATVSKHQRWDWPTIAAIKREAYAKS